MSTPWLIDIVLNVSPLRSASWAKAGYPSVFTIGTA